MADAERTCDKCGKTFKSDGAWYAKHALSCDGTKPATSGRIRSVERTPAAAKKTRVPRKTKSKRADSRPGRPARRSPIKASPYAAAIAELEAQRGRHLTDADRCTKAIDALEAMA